MRICFLSSVHTPRDKRVFDKEAVSLAKAGFEVIHLAPGDTESASRERDVEIVTYCRPKGVAGRILAISRLYELALKVDADCYHCNEVDTWFVGVLLKLTRHRKVVFDVHEHFPSTFAESRFPGWLRRPAASAVLLVYRVLLPFTDHVVLAKQSVAYDFVGSEKKQVLVRNFTSVAFRELRKQTEINSDAVTAIHLGLISRERGWPQLLEAIARAQSRNLRVHIIGTFNDGSQAAFDQCVLELGLNGRICVEDWMLFEQAYQRLMAADIGLVLFQPGHQNHVYAFPHKMFDYMLAGLPVIAPFFAEEIAPIIRESDCGLLLDPSNPDEIAQVLDHLVVDASERRRLGQNGRRAVLERYNWEVECEKLITMYTEMKNSLG